MIDPRKLLDDLLASWIPGTDTTVRDTAGDAVRLAKDNPIATGAIALAMLGTRPGLAITSSALRIGGLAAVAGLAYKAFQNYRQGAAVDVATAPEAEILPPPANSAFDPAVAPQGESEFALAIIRAMVAAANADGRIDDQERSRIAARFAEAGIASEEGLFLARELSNPRNIEDIAAMAQTDPQKVELYTASRVVLDPANTVARSYLERLATRLGLPTPLVQHIEATVGPAG